MTDLFDVVRDRARASTSAARSLVPLIAGEMKVTRRDLNVAMVAAYGGTDADGCWTQRDSFEMLVGSLESQVMTSAKRFETLNIDTGGKSIDPLPVVEQSPRPLTKLAVAIAAAEESAELAVEE